MTATPHHGKEALIILKHHGMSTVFMHSDIRN